MRKRYQISMTPDLGIDARNLLCPLPVLRLRKRMQPLEPGALVEIITTDPAAIVDVPHFCAESGHEVVSSTEAEGETTWHIRKAGS